MALKATVLDSITIWGEELFKFLLSGNKTKHGVELRLILRFLSFLFTRHNVKKFHWTVIEYVGTIT